MSVSLRTFPEITLVDSVEITRNLREYLGDEGKGGILYELRRCKHDDTGALKYPVFNRHFREKLQERRLNIIQFLANLK